MHSHEGTATSCSSGWVTMPWMWRGGGTVLEDIKGQNQPDITALCRAELPPEPCGVGKDGINWDFIWMWEGSKRRGGVKAADKWSLLVMCDGSELKSKYN